jgi:hypothetical protein
LSPLLFNQIEYKEPIYTTNSFASDPVVIPEPREFSTGLITSQEQRNDVDEGSKDIPHSFLDSLNIKPVPKRQLNNPEESNQSFDNQEY